MTFIARCRSFFVLGFVLVSMGSSAHSADFPEPYNSEKDKNATPLSAEATVASMKLPPGFHASVFASEPTIRNPIAMTWDSRGRIWIAENFTYAESSQRFDLNLRDRVLILDDTDQDGHVDVTKVFSDQLQVLTSVEVGRGGVWLMCPPQLLFIPDADSDDVPDGPAQVVLDGFEIGRTSHHNFANGLRWGPDGWLYGRCGGSCPGKIGAPNSPSEQRVSLEGGIWRYSPDSKVFEVLCHGTTNPWGHDWNEFGDLFFINTVNGHLWHGIPGAHLVRPFTLDPNQSTYESIDMHADHWHFDTGKGWQNSRTGAESYGGGHAHTGMMIYLGNQWPDEFRGKLLTFNYHGRRINQERLEREGSGFVAKHEPDMLVNDDPFFRGMELSYGPDGSVVLLDWSDTGECHENSGVHRQSGRIYRITHGTPNRQANTTAINLRDRSDADLTALLRADNEWFIRQARLVLIERARAGKDLHSVQAELLSMLQSENPRIACNALYTLHAISAIEDRSVASNAILQSLQHKNEHVRAAAVRLLMDQCPIDDVYGPFKTTRSIQLHTNSHSEQILPKLLDLARNDQSSLVRLAIASNISRLPVPLRAKVAIEISQHHEENDDHNLPLLVWYGLMPVAKESLPALASICAESHWPKLQRFIARRISEEIDKHPDLVVKLLNQIRPTPTQTGSESDPFASARASRDSILNGIADGLKGRRKVEKPANWNAVLQVIQVESSDPIASTIQELNVLFGDGIALEAIKKIVADPKAEIGIRQSAFQSLVNSSQEDIRDLCIPLLNDQRLNVIAAQGLNRTDDPEVAKTIIKAYGRFRGYERPKVISILVSRKSFANALLDAVENKSIPITDLTPYDIRQIRSLGAAELDQRVTEVWGELRDSSKEKLNRIHQLKESLTKEVLTLPTSKTVESFSTSNARNAIDFTVKENKLAQT